MREGGEIDGGKRAREREKGGERERWGRERDMGKGERYRERGGRERERLFF